MDATSRRLVDLSHPIAEGMVTYPGLPGPELTDHLTRTEAEERYGPGVTFHIGRISMIANTGTYVDSPFHATRTVSIWRASASSRSPTSTVWCSMWREADTAGWTSTMLPECR